MKDFIQHIVKENLAQIAADSYFNYGVRGLHMINLIDTPTKGLRLFIAESNNMMQHSMPLNYSNGITYPFQNYQRNFKTQCIQGYVSIWTVEESNDQIALLTNEYKLAENEDGDYVYVMNRQHVGLQTKTVYNLQPGQAVSLSGNELYNFGTRFGAQSAWFVYEGRENKTDYVFYTNKDNLSADDGFPGMYSKVSAKDVVALLSSVGLI